MSTTLLHRTVLLLALLSIVSGLYLVLTGGVTSKLRHVRDSWSVLGAGARTCAVVYGTRPELIKMAPLVYELQRRPEVCKLLLVTSGQHQQMLDGLQRYFGLEPDVDLSLMRTGDTLAALAVRSTEAFTRLWQSTRPALVIVQGDTTTALEAGLAAFHVGIRVAHVEAGLRTGDLEAPYPEEFNRQTLGLVCSLCFPPTQLAASALANEAVDPARIVMTGNTVVDAVQHSAAHPPPEAADGVRLTTLAGPKSRSAPLTLTQTREKLLAAGRHVVLVTAHRRENTLTGAIHDIVTAIQRLATAHPGVAWVFPVHYNPLVREAVLPGLSNLGNVWLVDPPDYPVFVQVLRRVTLLVTDSGGLQEEGLALNIPVLITRTNTERMEGVLAGGAKLIGTNASAIQDNVGRLLGKKAAYNSMAHATNPYGDGHAAQRIVDSISSWWDAAMAAPPAHGLTRVSRTGNTLTKSNPTPAPIPSPLVRLNVNPKHAFERRPGSLGVVLTGYKRTPELLDMQLQALRDSSLVPDEIVFFQNENHQDFSSVLAKWPDVKHMHASSWNTKFHGRFAAALMLNTEFVAIADDEVVPGLKWLEAAVRVVDQLDCIVGNTGRIVIPDVFFEGKSRGFEKVRDATLNKDLEHPEPVQVDFVGHWWITRTQHLHAMWRSEPASLWTGEDVHLSAAAKLYHGVDTYVLDYPRAEYTPERKDFALYGKQQARDVASWAQPGTSVERLYVVKYWLEQGWKPMTAIAPSSNNA